MQYPQFGTVSEGTLKNTDLIRSFADEIEFLCGKTGADVEQYASLLQHADRCLSKFADARTDDRALCRDELIDALNEFAAPYSYFGAHPGDGADFGFWPDVDGLETAVFDGEITKVNAGDELSEDGEYMIVTDHGNVTFGYQQSGKFHEVWSCV